MTDILNASQAQRDRWEKQSVLIARELKKNAPAGKPELKIGIAFDDAFVTILLKTDEIKTRTAQQLAHHIYQLVTDAALLSLETKGKVQ